jgi:lysyl-tRNA synthetase class 2
MIELYQAYGDYETMMELTEAIFVNAIEAISAAGSGGELQAESTANEPGGSRPPLANPLVRPWGQKKIDYTPPWPRRKYADLFREFVHCDIHDAAAVAEAARRHNIETAGKHPDVVVNDVFEELVEHHLTGPVFVIDYPASMCPLTKRKRGQPDIAERFELFIDGMELANAYTELNDPRLQEELFKTQLAGLSEEESMAKMDHDFVRALKVGMPPAGGLGIGIDRLVMLLTNSHSIRDVIYFPLLRHEKPAGTADKDENSGEP